MGGTFDPVHYGHLVTAEAALWKFALDEVVIGGHAFEYIPDASRDDDNGRDGDQA